MNDTSAAAAYAQNQPSYEQNLPSYEFVDIPLPGDDDVPPEAPYPGYCCWDIPEDIPQSMPQGAQDSIPQSIPQRTQESMPQGAQDSIPQRTQESFPQSIPQRTQESIPQSIPQRTQESMPQGAQDSIPQRTQESFPQSMPQRTQESIPQSIPQRTQESMPQSTSEDIRQDIPQSTPGEPENADEPYVPISWAYGMKIPECMLSAQNVKPAEPWFQLHDTRFPVGEITIIAGAGGVGKGQFACAHMAYSSKGYNLMGKLVGAPKRSLFISAEDTASDIKRRIERCAFPADNRQIFLVGKTETYQEDIDLTDHDSLTQLKEWILVSGADIVYIDPLQAFVGEFADLSRQNHVRHIMHSLAALAEQMQCCIVLLMHLNKRQQILSAADLLCGSSDIVNAARSVMLLTNDFKDGDPDRRYLFHIKSNHAKSAQTLELNIGEHGNRIVGTSDLTPDDYVMAVNSRKLSKAGKAEIDYEQMFYKGVEQMIANGEKQSTFREFVDKYAPGFNGKAKYVLDDITVRVEERLGYIVQTKTSSGGAVKVDEGRGFRLVRL